MPSQDLGKAISASSSENLVHETREVKCRARL